MARQILRTAGAAAAAAGLLLVAAPAHAGPSGTIGGALLASPGVVVDTGPGRPALPAPLPASSWLVADATTGQVLAAKDAHGRFLPASTLKVLTAISLIPRLPAREIVTPTFDDLNVDGTKVGLVPGGRYRVGLLFMAMLLASGNDAADTLATAAGGDQQTLALMNSTAAGLQADDTRAGTPSGLDAPGQSSSAYDLALLFRAGLASPAFRHYISTTTAYVPDSKAHGVAFQIYTHDRLLTTYPGMIGGKNGYTIAAEGTFVGAATRGGHTIIVSLMHAYPDFWPMAQALLTWGFAADGRVTPVGQLAAPLPAVPPVLHVARVDTTPVAPATARVSHPGSSLELPLSLAAGTAVLATMVAWRGLRRRPRLRLPPL